MSPLWVHLNKKNPGGLPPVDPPRKWVITYFVPSKHLCPYFRNFWILPWDRSHSQHYHLPHHRHKVLPLSSKNPSAKALAAPCVTIDSRCRMQRATRIRRHWTESEVYPILTKGVIYVVVSISQLSELMIPNLLTKHMCVNYLLSLLMILPLSRLKLNPIQHVHPSFMHILQTIGCSTIVCSHWVGRGLWAEVCTGLNCRIYLWQDIPVWNAQYNDIM